MEQKQNRSAPEAPADESASPFNSRDSYCSPPTSTDPPPPSGAVTVPNFSPATVHDPSPAPDDILGFDPVPLRYRRDGLTPQRQRDYVEALADCGVARAAAARIGVSEQAVARVRRRADARSFDRACEAAHIFGARRLRSVAYERAVEGSVKRHYYHGELRSEEVVYDNRLLVYLLGKTAHLVEPPPEAQAIVDNWEPWMEAIEQGLPEPPAPAPEPEPEPEEKPDEVEEGDEEAFDFDDDDVWKDEDDIWWTRFPPTPDFYGYEEGVPGEDYKRTLSAAEFEAVEAREKEERDEELARLRARRDAWFGFRGARFPGEDGEEGGEASERDEEEDEDDEAEEPAVAHGERAAEPIPDPSPAGTAEGLVEAEVFSPRQAETNGTSEPSSTPRKAPPAFFGAAGPAPGADVDQAGPTSASPAAAPPVGTL